MGQISKKKKVFNSVLNFRRLTYFWLCLLETQACAACWNVCRWLGKQAACHSRQEADRSGINSSWRCFLNVLSFSLVYEIFSTYLTMTLNLTWIATHIYVVLSCLWKNVLCEMGHWGAFPKSAPRYSGFYRKSLTFHTYFTKSQTMNIGWWK